ncbi:swt1 RNA endoribonuclease isoform X3 [Rhodnius prolixus]|uniref:swt1 RNA endoribonuclease isoform X3 n=1 Tax=Rhodnius prolixus TaxID=13249 RepID=UPI003D18ABD5
MIGGDWTIKSRSKDTSDTDDSCSSIKKFKEANAKEGPRLAQKRLEKIRHEAKEKQKSEPHFGNKSSVSNKKGESSAKLTTTYKKQEQTPSKKRAKCNDEKSLLQLRLEKYRREKNQLGAIHRGESLVKREIPDLLDKKPEQSPSKKGTKCNDEKSSLQLRLEKYRREKSQLGATHRDNVSKSKIRKESNELKGSPKKQSSDGITIKNKKNNSPDAKEKAKKNLTRNLYKRRSQVPLAETKLQEIKSINRLKSGFQPTNLTINSQRCSNTDTKDQEVINKQDNFLNLNNNEVEDMEWEVSCDDVAVHLQTVRNAVREDGKIEMMDWQESPLQINKAPNSNIIHYVVDTNVFISALRVVKKIKESTIVGMESIIVIPWQVLKELDCLKMKKESHISTAARKAVSFLLECTTCHSPNVVWQTQQQAAKHCQEFYVEIPDDHIIKCCIQLISTGHNVVLISNDNNLRLKSSVYNITTISDDKLLEKMALHSTISPGKFPLEEAPKGSNVCDIYTHRLANMFSKFLNNVVQIYLQSEYGKMWLWHIPEKPPLSLKILLELIQNFAIKIFQTKEYNNYFDEISCFFRKKTYGKLKPLEVDSIARKCLQLAKLISAEERYSLEVLQFENDLAFMKSHDPSINNTPFSDLCCKLTIEHFRIFEASIIGYCYKVAQVLEIKISDPILCERASVSPKNFSIEMISEYLKMFKLMYINLERLGRILPRQISAHDRGIEAVYNTLVTFIEDPDPFFTLEDVAEFFKNDSIRCSLPEACNLFSSLINFLEAALKVSVSK